MSSNVLPPEKKLPIHNLASVFNNTTASYKFYWFLSILDFVEKGQRDIKYYDLFAQMVSNAWFTINYFNLDFGKADKLQRAIENIKDTEEIDITDTKVQVSEILKNTSRTQTKNELMHFKRQVPHWFLSPWFPGVKASVIKNDSKNLKNDCLYALHDNEIKINDKWLDYIQSNTKFLREFTLWNLALYLQNKNPSVPNIINKLERPPERMSLVPQRNFWNNLLKKGFNMNCIYTGEPIGKNYDLEHFLPYSFVAHNQIWNLIPADSSFNKMKNRKLPKLDIYLPSFLDQQYDALKFALDHEINSKILEDYYSVLPTLNLNDLSKEDFKTKLKNTIKPQHGIALSNGFEEMHDLG